ncbi:MULTISPECIES: hypothetical protein [Alphaproteobacteria]|uniref:Uncharacterized protein n=1 Tax=Sphingomonas sanxanigenens TaxID=397260 RepID=A0A2W5A8X8_9SPHN|nr:MULTISPECIES: hypothetical protein [Alphaproteobacteria]PZO90974.1 MAG: hypothetical protein DI623_04995 [Sphingomonas sanxanigenens]
MMGKVSSVAGNLLKVGLMVLLVVWVWGARRQAGDRHCYPVKATQEEAFGFFDWIATGWDWPLHWINGTRAEPIPCKPGVIGIMQGKVTVDISDDVWRGSEAFRSEAFPGVGGVVKNGHNPLDAITSSPVGHRYLDRYLAEHSGNRAATPGATPTTATGDEDQGLSPEARDLLDRRLQEMNRSNVQR